jgi:hypothetical protein
MYAGRKPGGRPESLPHGQNWWLFATHQAQAVVYQAAEQRIEL